MKTLRTILTVAGLFLAGSLFAQRGVQATVPFSFYVGNSQLMPSGTYRIAPCSAFSIVVTNCSSGLSVFQMTSPADTESKDKSKLVFDRYGDTYFLREVKSPSLSTVLTVAKNEKKFQERATVRTFETITVPKGDETKPLEK